MHRFPKMDVANGSARVDILNSLLAKLCYAMSKGSHLFTREFTAHKIMSKGRKIPFDLGSSHILLLKHGKLARSILSKLALYSNPVFSRFPSKIFLFFVYVCLYRVYVPTTTYEGTVVVILRQQKLIFLLYYYVVIRSAGKLVPDYLLQHFVGVTL